MRIWRTEAEHLKEEAEKLLIFTVSTASLLMCMYINVTKPAAAYTATTQHYLSMMIIASNEGCAHHTPSALRDLHANVLHPWPAPPMAGYNVLLA